MRWVAGLLLSVLFLITLSMGQQTALDWYYDGINLYDQGKYSEAVWAFDNASSIDSSYIESWFYKGEALSKIENYTEAIKAYQEVIELGSIETASEKLAIMSSEKIGYIKGRNENEISFNQRKWIAVCYSIIPVIIAFALLAAIWSHKDEQKRLLWISLLYADILILMIGVVSIFVWGKPDPVIAYVPTPILEWAFIGAIVAVLYRLANRENIPGTRLYLWIIAKPMVGLAMGALVYFIALGGSILLGGQITKGLPNNTIYWLCALAFIGGFSDKFSMDLMDRFVSASLKEEDAKVNHQK